MKKTECDETVIMDDSDLDSSMDVSPSKLKIISLNSLPSKADLMKTIRFNNVNKYQNYRNEVDRIKKHIREDAEKHFNCTYDTTTPYFYPAESLAKPLSSLISPATSKVTMPFQTN